MKGLAIMSRTSDPRTLNLASFHSPHSLTWSWILLFHRPRADEGRWLHFSSWRTNCGRQWCLQIARHALQWHRQQPMWFRDLWQKARDENDALKYQTRTPRLPGPPPRSPFNPVVIDGGSSLH